MRGRAAGQLPRLAERCDLTANAAKLALFLKHERDTARPVCAAIGAIGPTAVVAVPALLAALEADDERLGLEAAKALWRIERRADLVLPTLDRLFDSCDESVCDLLCDLGPAGRPMLPRLIEALLAGDNWDLQWAAADAIGCVSSGDPASLEALKFGLSHASSRVNSSAANSLALVGKPALPMLLAMLSDETDSKTQENVAMALWRMGPAAVEAAPALRQKLASPHRGLRIWAAIALAKITGDADAIDPLAEVFEDANLGSMWGLACEALADIGPPAAEFRGFLAELAASPIDELQAAAQLALEAIDRPPS